MTENTEKTAGSNLTAIAEYTETAAALAELRQKHQGVVYDVTNPKQMKLAKEARAEVKGYRVALEKMRVEIKAPALERCRLIDSEAKRITAELLALEEPLDVQIKAEEDRLSSLTLHDAAHAAVRWFHDHGHKGAKVCTDLEHALANPVELEDAA